jgi:hypothetical protein
MRFKFYYFILIFFSLIQVGCNVSDDNQKNSEENVTEQEKFNAFELIDLSEMELDELDTYVTEKGFKFKEIQEFENPGINEIIYGEINVYDLERNNENTADKMISVYNPSSISGDWQKSINGIIYQTGDENEYLKIKSEIKKMGYLLIGQDNYDGGLYFDYKKSNCKISLGSEIGPNGSTTYVVNVSHEYE